MLCTENPKIKTEIIAYLLLLTPSLLVLLMEEDHCPALLNVSEDASF